MFNSNTMWFMSDCSKREKGEVKRKPEAQEASDESIGWGWGMMEVKLTSLLKLNSLLGCAFKDKPSILFFIDLQSGKLHNIL